MRLSARAPGKVNLCLFVGPGMDDGRHQVVTLLESVSLHDRLTLTTFDDGRGDEVVCEGVEGPNIVSAALAGLRARGWNAPPVRVEIEKRIPVAGGMGGGSADAAAVLRLAAELEPVAADVVSELAAELGTDVPSQLEPGLSLGVGAGDRVRPLRPLAPHALVIVPLPARLSAGEVYAEFDRLGVVRDAAELDALRDRVLEAGSELRAELLVNDLQPAATSLCPEIGGALDALRGAGADRALVSGSGPTAVGLMWGPGAAERAQAAASSLSDRFLGASSAVPVGADFGYPQVAAQLHD